ncbi:MAG: sulfurtransferase [Oligoflexia bacterium]|nr:sulfurtransferase [Oligoflexia bacterium]
MSSIANIAFYKFTQLEERQSLKEFFESHCGSLGIRGTVLLAPEGINANLAGTLDSINQLIDELQTYPWFPGVELKWSFSATIPFKRLLIKLKNEIITVRDDSIVPIKETGAYVEPEELQKWLDDGREVVLLDTRNDFEYAVGTFKGAINPNIERFTQFKDYVQKHRDEFKDKTVVTFCTGGIRCEKATGIMMHEGIHNVYQLHGGILDYFKKVGGKHWTGSCFVFDERLALTPGLDPIEGSELEQAKIITKR